MKDFVYDLIKDTLTTMWTKETTPEKKHWEKTLDFNEKISYNKEELISTYFFISHMAELLNRMQSALKPMIEKLALSEDKELLFDGNKVMIVEIEDYDYLDDAILNKYITMENEINAKVKEIKDSIKNRKEALVNSDKALKLPPKRQTRTYLK